MKNVLIVRLSALGDTVCSLPVAVALKDSFPDVKITWVVDPRFAPIVSSCDAVDHVLAYKPNPFKPPALNQVFDLAIDLQGLIKSAITVGFAKAIRKVGYHWQREGAALFSERILPDPSSHHVVDQYVDVARAVGASADRAQFRLKVTADAKDSIRRKLSAIGAKSDYVVINPGAGWATKRYPVEHWIQFCRAMPIRVVCIGGRGEIGLADAIVAGASGNVVSLSGETQLEELAALIEGARAHVGGDTGSTHLAAALGVPAIGLYSVTLPSRTCPYGQILRCLYQPSGLADIAPAAVVEKTLEALN